jgi:hypothetical protein
MIRCGWRYCASPAGAFASELADCGHCLPFATDADRHRNFLSDEAGVLVLSGMARAKRRLVEMLRSAGRPRLSLAPASNNPPVPSGALNDNSANVPATFHVCCAALYDEPLSTLINSGPSQPPPGLALAIGVNFTLHRSLCVATDGVEAPRGMLKGCAEQNALSVMLAAGAAPSALRALVVVTQPVASSGPSRTPNVPPRFQGWPCEACSRLIARMSVTRGGGESGASRSNARVGPVLVHAACLTDWAVDGTGLFSDDNSVVCWRCDGATPVPRLPHLPYLVGDAFILIGFDAREHSAFSPAG